jgi:hypothetical protein
MKQALRRLNQTYGADVVESRIRAYSPANPEDAILKLILLDHCGARR